MADDILKRLENHTIKGRKRVNGRHHYCHKCDAIDEIKRLLAELAAERALADQLADALRWQADPYQKGTLMMSHRALDAYEKIRRG